MRQSRETLHRVSEAKTPEGTPQGTLGVVKAPRQSKKTGFEAGFGTPHLLRPSRRRLLRRARSSAKGGGLCRRRRATCGARSTIRASIVTMTKCTLTWDEDEGGGRDLDNLVSSPTQETFSKSTKDAMEWRPSGQHRADMPAISTSRGP